MAQDHTALLDFVAIVVDLPLRLLLNVEKNIILLLFSFNDKKY